MFNFSQEALELVGSSEDEGTPKILVTDFPITPRREIDDFVNDFDFNDI